MIHYLVTFVPGFSAVVKKMILREFRDSTIIHSHEASVVFATELPYAEFDKKPYFTNVYLVTAMLETNTSMSDTSIVKQLSQKSHFQESLQASGKKKASTFRIMVQKGSRLVHIPKEIQKKIITNVTHQTGLLFSPLKADMEIWFMLRTEGFAYCTIKFPSQFIQPTKTEKGELQPHLAYLLNVLSQPRHDDVYLDPFAGYGSLPYNRAKSFRYRKILAYDKDSVLVSALKKRLERFPTTYVELGDAFRLTRVGDKTINKIVTDPPWGIYDTELEVDTGWFTGLLKEFQRVIIPGGIIVLLTGKPEALKAALPSFDTFSVKQEITTLVNGKKATVFVILS